MDVFLDFRNAVESKINQMLSTNNKVFKTEVSKDLMWEKYLNSFPGETNSIFRERGSYDCQACKRFIKAVGNMVIIKNGELVSIWDIDIENETYKIVSKKMSNYIKLFPIKNEFLHTEKIVGVSHNKDDKTDK